MSDHARIAAGRCRANPSQAATIIAQAIADATAELRQDGIRLDAIEGALSDAGIDFKTRDHAEAVRELTRRAEWQPIETAPKDGTRILLCHQGVNDIGIVLEGYYCEDEGWYESNTHPTDVTDGLCHPTHWQPLPAPPAAMKE